MQIGKNIFDRPLFSKKQLQKLSNFSRYREGYEEYKILFTTIFFFKIILITVINGIS